MALPNQRTVDKWLKEADKVFFDFKDKEYGNVGFAAVIVTPKSLRSITQIGFVCRATDSKLDITSETSYANELEINRPPFKESYEWIHEILHRKVVIGHGLLQDSKWERFEAECQHIGRPPPVPLLILDTSFFTRSKTKLARLSLLIGLGPISDACIDKCRMSLTFIQKLTTLMSIFKIGKAGRGFYPTLCYLMKFHGNSGFVGEEDKIRESPKKRRRESTTDMDEDVEQYAVFVDFQEDDSGMRHIAALGISTKTLKTYNPLKVGVLPEDTLESDRMYINIYDSLNGKTWIGHDVLESGWPRLRKEFECIGQPPPMPKKIVDIAYFVSSKTKLAQLARLFGMDKPPVPKFWGYLKYIAAIKRCGVAMSILDMRMKDSKVHPMISHIMDFQPAQAPRKSERLKEKSKTLRRS